MATNVIMPSLGFDMTEGKLADWLKKEGDRVEKGQAIAEIETEKATVEIDAGASGVLKKISVQAGQTVPIGTVIGIIAAPEETLPAASAPAAPAAPAKEATPARTTGTPAAPAQEPAPAGNARPAETRVKASPLARKMAESAGVDLTRIQGTGPGGRVMDRDVQAAIGQNAPAHASSKTNGQVQEKTGAPVPLNKMRQAIARRMTESKTTAPHFYVTMEIDMAEAIRIREQMNNVLGDEERISINDLLIAAAAKTLVQFPNLNASFRDGALELHPQIHVGIAVALEDGLVTPVLRDADKKTLRTIAAESKALSERARSNKMRSEDIGSSTFTISNLGMFGVDEFIAIINPPEAAILAVGMVAQRPVVSNGEIRIAPIVKATLSVDHRVADGAQAGRFLQQLKKLLENPVNLLTDI